MALSIKRIVSSGVIPLFDQICVHPLFGIITIMCYLYLIIKELRFPWYGPFRPSCFSFVQPAVCPTGTYGRRVQLKLESNPFLVEQRFAETTPSRLQTDSIRPRRTQPQLYLYTRPRGSVSCVLFPFSLSLYLDQNLSWEISIRIMSWGISIGVHVVLISQCRPAASRRRQSDP
jgi:hypothetical protein